MPEYMDYLLVSLVVCAAVAYMGRKYWKKFTGQESCGCSGCGSCGCESGGKHDELEGDKKENDAGCSCGCK